MKKKHKVIRLAEKLTTPDAGLLEKLSAAEELRRLHLVNQELLEALKWLCESHQRFSGGVWDKARAAIAKAEAA